MQALIAKVRATPSIRVLEGYEADELIVATAASKACASSGRGRVRQRRL